MWPADYLAISIPQIRGQSVEYRYHSHCSASHNRNGSQHCAHEADPYIHHETYPYIPHALR